MLPTNVYSFMKKMVSNTETLSTPTSASYNLTGGGGSGSGLSASSPGGISSMAAGGSPPGGAMGRLRQTLEQAQETVTRLRKPSSASIIPSIQQPQLAVEPPKFTTTDVDNAISPTSAEFKEITELPRPGTAGRCRVCVKLMKPDEFFRECTECGLRVCDDCASYSSHADGNNEANWRCSVCRRKGVAIIARRVQVGIESSEALEGVGFETKVRKSPDTRRLQAGDRADSETEVLLLAPKPSDVRRHSDVPLRDIAKFQAQSNISAATSQHEGLSVNTTTTTGQRARSSTEIMKKENNNVVITKEQLKKKAPAPAPMKRQRSYERGASEGTLNLPGNNRGRRASCDLRAIDPNTLNNLNNIADASTSKETDEENKEQQQPHQSHQQHQHQHHQQKHHQQQQHDHQQQQSNRERDPRDRERERHGGARRESCRVKVEKDENLAIRQDTTRRRSVQIYNTTGKPQSTPRSCASLDTGDNDLKKKDPSSTGTAPGVLPMKRQGSSTDGEAIKIVIDDVDSTNKKKDNNNKLTELNEQRTRIVRLRRDPQDRGYQTRGFGLRVVGGCSSKDKPGNLRARVARVTAGSGADFAGIRRGDFVLFWNGIKLTNLTFEEVCKVIDASPDSIELQMACYEDQLINSCVPEDDDGTIPATVTGPDQQWDEVQNDGSLAYNAERSGAGGEPISPTRGGRKLPRLPSDGRIQLRLYHDEIHNTLEIAVVNIAFGQDDSSTLDLNDILITLRIGDKMANTRWNQCTLFTKVSPEDLFDSWLIMELIRGSVGDFIGEAHVDMGRVSLDDRPVWFPFSSKGTSGHRGSIAQIVSSNNGATPSARELARRLRMRGLAGSQSQSEEQDDSSGQSSPCASSLLRPEVAWEVLGTLGPPGVVLTCRSAPTSRRGSAQSDRMVIVEGAQEESGRGSLPSTPQMPRSLPPSRRGSFAVAVEEVINRSRRGSVAYQQQRAPDYLGRLLPEIPDGGPDPAMLRNRRTSAWNPREIGFDRRQQFERTDSLRQINPQGAGNRRVSADFRDFSGDARNRQQRKSMCVIGDGSVGMGGGGVGGVDDSWRQQSQQQQQQQQSQSQQQQWSSGGRD